MRVGRRTVFISRQVRVLRCHRGSENPDYNEEDCRGYYSGYDTATTNALCLSKEMCMEVCSDIRDCIVIDMHREIPRPGA